MKNYQTIEVYKTNIRDIEQRDRLLEVLTHHFPLCKINVDLHDCDKVLRVAFPERETYHGDAIPKLVSRLGISIEELE